MRRSLAAMACAVVATSVQGQTVDYPQPLTRDSVGDWTVECYAANQQQCQLYQRVVAPSGAIVMVMTFAWDAEAAALRTQVAVPLGVNLGSGGQLALQNGFSATLPIARCTQQGCLVEGQVTGNFLDALRQSGSGSLTVVDPASGDMVIPISLSGFEEGLGRIAPASALQPANSDNLAPVTGQ